MKILSNNKYKELKAGYDLTEVYRIEKEENQTSHTKEILFYENQVEHIKNMLIDIVDNKKMAKEKMINKINDIIRFIYNGEQ